MGSLDEFLWWMYERQEIFRRKELLGHNPPWTADAVLRDFHFCHVYRRLDRGTQYALEEILSRDNKAGVFLNIVVYRFLNRVESFDAMGGYIGPEAFNVAAARQRLRELDTVFGAAYRINPPQRGYNDHVGNVLDVVENDVLSRLDFWVDAVFDADSMEQAWKLLTGIPGVGEFLAYELVTDLNYRHLPFSENDFVNVGPGAAIGADRIWDVNNDQETEDQIRWVVQEQDRLYDNTPYELFQWDGKKQKPLTCRSVEHALCEYGTYHRIRHEAGAGRTYDPKKYEQKPLTEFL